MEKVFGNVIEQDSLKTELELVFSELDNILKDHSGPFATNSVIGSKWRQANDIDEFTKDGIKILRHLVVSDEAVSRFATRMARFIGIAVDKRCHDGTTTSMLLFCRLALCATQQIDSDFYSNTRYNLVKAIDDALGLCLNEIEALKISEDDIYNRCVEFGINTSLEEVRASIAYHMSMISSKGDHDLSTKIAYVVKSCPKKIFGMFTDTPLAVETSEKYVLKKQAFDLSLSCNIGNVQDYNYKNNTQWLSENAVIFSTGNDIATNSFEALFLSSFISTNPRQRINLSDFGNGDKGWEAFHEGKRNLIILSPMLSDHDLITEINIFNANNPNIRISYFNVQVHPRMRASLNKTIHYMAGVQLFQDVQGTDAVSSLIGLNTDVRAHLIGHTLTLNNLYVKEDGDVYHPFYRNPDLFEPYTRFATETEELINFANEHITNPALDHDELTYLISLYRSLTCQEIYDIDIGGSAHDQYANRTVYEDAIGAALSAVNEGVILGGYAHLAKFFGDITVAEKPADLDVSEYEAVSIFQTIWMYLVALFSSSKISSDEENSDIEDDVSVNEFFYDTFVSIVEDSLRVHVSENFVVDAIENALTSKWHYLAAEPSKWRNATRPEDYIFVDVLDKAKLEHFLTRGNDSTILLQAFGGYHEQFKRCRDILPKLANTTHLADMRMPDGSDVR